MLLLLFQLLYLAVSSAPLAAEAADVLSSFWLGEWEKPKPSLLTWIRRKEGFISLSLSLFIFFIFESHMSFLWGSVGTNGRSRQRALFSKGAEQKESLVWMHRGPCWEPSGWWALDALSDQNRNRGIGSGAPGQLHTPREAGCAFPLPHGQTGCVDVVVGGHPGVGDCPACHGSVGSSLVRL